MKVKTIERFTDLKEDKVREVNDEFEVSKERYEEVKRFVVEVEEVEEIKEVEEVVEVVEVVKAPKKKKGD